MIKTKTLLGFTLAEVLITLGIIGIVAAMTIPTLMTKFAKSRTETQLKTFYSKINQTVKMSIAENGDPEGWITPNKSYAYKENVEFLKTYFFPYMKNLGYYDCSGKHGVGAVCISLYDGGYMSFNIDKNGGDINYYINVNKDDVLNYHKDDIPIHNFQQHVFGFQFAKFNNSVNRETISENYVEPYIFEWNGTREGLKNVFRGCTKGCQRLCLYCTKLIQMSDWKIPNDYPW